MDLAGKVALVTGASRGIGRATALALARGGAKLSIIARNKEQLEAVAREIGNIGSEPFVFAGDLLQENIVKDLVARTIQQFGRLDILINNAGIGHFSTIAEMSTEMWEEMFNLNMRSVFWCTRESLPHLRKAGESVIVNVASLAGKNAFKGGGGYAATKHALLGFSRCLMLEERENGVRMLAICPGSVSTSFDQGRRAADDPKRQRILQADDVAETIIHMIKMPQNAMISEIDMRPSNP